MITDQDRVEEAIKTIFAAIREDEQREGLEKTPNRYWKFISKFVSPEPFTFTTFSADTDEMVIVKDIPFYSLCEHHILPFFGVAHIGYIPSDKIAGLSKIPRALDLISRKLQNQERITQQIADYLIKELDPVGVGVIINARHMCMEMRGVEKPGTITITSAMRGKFKDQVNTRQEFLNLIK